MHTIEPSALAALLRLSARLLRDGWWLADPPAPRSEGGKILPIAAVPAAKPQNDSSKGGRP